VGMVAGFIPEWWPVFDRNGGRLHVGIRTWTKIRAPRPVPASYLTHFYNDEHSASLIQYSY
ncbi:hypothetical protein NKI16_33525, partial [Mesorhizobium sp. M0698]